MIRPDEPARKTAPDGNSYGDIVRSSSIMGGVAALTMLVGMARTKLAAILIGATGTGLLANLTALQGVLTSAASLGIYASAVRDIAKAQAAGQADEIARAVITLRRACWVTGFLGALATVAFSQALSHLSFGSDKYQWHVALLALTVLLGNVQGGQMALLQGTRRIAEMARVQVISAAIAATAMVLFFYSLGLAGVVPALLVASAIQLAVSWVHTRNVRLAPVRMGYRESFTQARSMARLGFAIMWTGLLGAGVAYGVNALVAHQFDLQALGIYGAAYALSGMLANFVLGAMGTDYYPRLAGVAHDDGAVNRLVNEQTEVGLLLAMPGLVATITLAPWALRLFYTAEYLPAANLLHWFCLGCLGRVISWPLGYMLMAKASHRWLIACESTTATLHLILAYAALRQFGLLGAAMAFVCLYVVYIAIVYSVARHLTSFHWSRECVRQIGIGAVLVLAGWAVARLEPLALSTAVAVPLIMLAGVHSIRGLTSRLGEDHVVSQIVARTPLLRLLKAKQAYSP